MIVSRTRGFIYCRLPKTASTSMREALSPYRDLVERSLISRAVYKLSKRRIGGTFMPFRDYSHLSMAGVQRHLDPEFFTRALKFTVARHPEKWVASYYNHVLRDNLPTENVKVFAEVRAKADFGYFLDWMADRPLRPQCTMLLASDGSFLVDQVARLERLSEEISMIAEELNLAIRVPHHNSGGYTPSSLSIHEIDQIERLFASDYCAFGYSPGGGIGEVDLRATDATRTVANSLGADGLARYKPWRPYL